VDGTAGAWCARVITPRATFKMLCFAAAALSGCVAGEVFDDGEDGSLGGGRDAGGGDDGLVAVAHDRELRGVWIATVYNINFPSRPGLPAQEQQAELTGLLDTIEAAGLNAVFFQVRPEGDALYASSLEPWSRFLTGTQGQDPGYDPLAFLIDEAHARGVEVHAWLNPYRAQVNRENPVAAPHVAVTMPEHMRAYGSLLWMDPGAPAVRDHTVEVVLDLVRRYAIDGIHFDDYFYPYPDGTSFPDDATFAAYVEADGELERDDWRRDNVNRLIERLSEEIAAEAPHVRFGISPFGIYRPGIPEGITGLDQYASLFADPVAWMQNDWLDYIAPQLYWNSTRPQQDYGTLLDWWTTIVGEGRYVFAGNYLAMLGTEPAWSVDEFRQQLLISRAHRGDGPGEGSMGNIHYHVGPLASGREQIDLVLRDEFYATPALTPPVALLRDVPVAAPDLTLAGGEVVIEHADPASLRAWVVYREGDAGFEIDRIVPASRARLDLGPGRWAISAAGRHGVESEGRVVEL
jgi:uncharacterized lipoprotein YddW (UPF0748 family)